MSDDAEFWDKRYSEASQIWSGAPNPHLVAEVSELVAGSALEVGAGEGADAIWLAEQGWTVLAVDISDVALERGKMEAATRAGDIAGRITWQQEDLTVWSPEPASFDLVTAQFMHLPAEVRVPVYRGLAAAVKPGGALLVVAHHPSDLETSVRRPKAPDLFVTAEQLEEEMGIEWTTSRCEKRPRPAPDADGVEVTVHDTIFLGTK